MLCSNILGKITLILNRNCNLRCFYCTSSRELDTKYEIENNFLLDKKIDMLYNISKQYGYDFELSGGEPALLKEDLLNKVLKYPLFLRSNGLIFNTQALKDNIDNIKQIYYHIAPDITINKKINKDYPEKTKYIFIIHKKNIDKISSFIENNLDIIFDPVFMDSNNKPYTIKNILILSDYYKIKDIVIKYPDNFQNTFKMLLDIKIESLLNKKTEYLLKQDCYNNNFIVCNLYENTAQFCCPYSKKIDLDNVENLIQNKTEYLSFSNCIKCSNYIISKQHLRSKNETI